MEDTGMDEICHYENLRKKNLEDNKLVLANLMSGIRDQIVKKPVTVQKKKRKSALIEGGFLRRNPSRHGRFSPSRFDLPGTRSRARARSGSVSSTVSSTSSSSSTPSSSPEKLVVRFGFFKKSNASESASESSDLHMDESSDDEIEDHPLPQINRKPRTNLEAKRSEEITEADLDMVARTVHDKKYDSTHGTTCHQCRQKTNDMKTICRSENCRGVRGQFCGPCLKNRYGEDARLSLLDKDWHCPPCRGICNCSFCRKKNNKSATGILIHLARGKGYSDVNSYLQGLKQQSD